VQRAVKKWRRQQAQRIIAEGAAIIVQSPEIPGLATPEHYDHASHDRAVAGVGF
jgi:hypothetical protein